MTKALFLAAALIGVASSAQADSIPKLVGAWDGDVKTVFFGQEYHNKEAPNRGKIALVDRKVSFAIEGQDGARFWGKWTTGDATYDMVGAFRSDGRSFVAAGTNGSMTAVMKGRNRFEACYTHSTPKHALANCSIYTRAKK